MEESSGAFVFSPSTYLQGLPMFTPEHEEQYNLVLEDLLENVDTGGIQQHPHRAEHIIGPSTDNEMEVEIARREAGGPLGVDGDYLAHSGLRPVGDGGRRDATGMASMDHQMQHLEKAPGEATPLEGNAARIDFSTATDAEIIDHLRARLGSKEQRPNLPELDTELARLEPWELPENRRLYSAYGMWSSEEKTGEGYWEQEGGLEAIRDGKSVRIYSGRYVGLKRTLVFYTNDGTKTNWRMAEYLPLYCSEGDFFIEGMVSRWVFENGGASDSGARLSTNPASTSVNGEREEDELDHHQRRARYSLLQLLQALFCWLQLQLQPQPQALPSTALNNQAPSAGKRARTDEPKSSGSDVWHHFTRIYIKVPKEQSGSKKKKDGKKLIYAVCHYCDKVFDADSRQGTSHHKRHAEACLCKHSRPSSSTTC